MNLQNPSRCVSGVKMSSPPGNEQFLYRRKRMHRLGCEHVRLLRHALDAFDQPFAHPFLLDPFDHPFAHPFVASLLHALNPSFLSSLGPAVVVVAHSSTSTFALLFQEAFSHLLLVGLAVLHTVTFQIDRSNRDRYQRL